MGLDMYLEASGSIHTSNFGRGQELNTKLRKMADQLGLPADNAGVGNYGSVVQTITVHAGYWRKANAIHAWFVKNVQGGVDECQRSPVTIEQLRQLRADCKQVLEAAKVEPGKIQTGTVLVDSDAITITTSEHRTGTPILEDGAVVTNANDVAAEVLPTTSGFFFGSTEYDSWYLADLGHTVDVIDRCLAAASNPDTPAEIEFFYQASW